MRRGQPPSDPPFQAGATDETDEPSVESADESASAQRAIRRLTLFIASCAATWSVLLMVHVSLPGVRSGSDQIYQRKLEYLKHGAVWSETSEIRVVVSGNSKVLSGFQSNLFEEWSDGRVGAFNLGLPRESHFIDELQNLCQRGLAPTHVLLTLGWSPEPRPTTWDRLHDDEWIMEQLFPFRRLPRNLVLFSARARSRGGVRDYYHQVLATSDAMIADRGYHFIESQSHFPDHRLPDDFRDDRDSESRIWTRECEPAGAIYSQLRELQQAHGFSVYFVPYYLRRGEYGLPESPSPLAARFAGYGVQALGPDYYLLPNAWFSDPVHLNPQGAVRYTKKLWELLQDEGAIEL